MTDAPPNPSRESLDDLLRRAVAAYEAMDPVDRALLDDEQRRFFVRGQTGRDPGPSVLAEEVRRLRALQSQSDPTPKDKTDG